MLESKDDKIKSSKNKEPIVKSSKTKNKKNSDTKESVKKPVVNEKITDPTELDNVSDQKDEIVVEESVDSAKASKEDSDSKEEIVNTQDTSGIDKEENKLEDLAKEDEEVNQFSEEDNGPLYLEEAWKFFYKFYFNSSDYFDRVVCRAIFRNYE